MSFKVNSADIRAYSDLIDRAQGDMHAAADHLTAQSTGFADMPPSGGSLLWKGVLTQHRNLVNRTDTAFRRYKHVLDRSGQELRGSARYYEATDTEEARKVDATYPGGLKKVPPPSAEATAQGFADREDAQAAFSRDTSLFGADGPIAARYDGAIGDRAASLEGNLQKGKELAAIGDGVGMVLDLTSPSTLINEGLKLAFNFDLLDACAQMIAGDWQQFDKMERVWSDLQQLARAVAVNIAGGSEALSATWQGQAATTGYHYFSELVQKLGEFADRFDQIINAYEELAADIAAFVGTLKAAITMILDTAIMAALKAAAAAAAAATGVGLVTAPAATASIALDVIFMIEKYSHVLQALTLLYGVLNMIEGTTTSALETELSKITNFPVPGGSYDHQAV